MTRAYKTEEGCVIDTKHECVVYEPVEGVNATDIAKILNEYHAHGLFPDWCEVAHVLLDEGNISDLGLCDNGVVYDLSTGLPVGNKEERLSSAG